MDTILICKLKEEKKNGTWVLGAKRTHNKKFEVTNPTPGDVLNIKKVCDVLEEKTVKTSKKEVIEKTVKSTAKDNSKELKELTDFATDLWNLADKLQKKIAELETPDPVKDVTEKEEEKPASKKRARKTKK